MNSARTAGGYRLASMRCALVACALLLCAASCRGQEPVTMTQAPMLEALPAVADAVPADGAQPARATTLEAAFAGYLRDRYRIADRRFLLLTAGNVPWVAVRNQLDAHLKREAHAEPLRLDWHRAGYDLYALWKTDAGYVGLAMERDQTQPLLGYFVVEPAD